ncbi:MAG: hypothetical protein V1871_07240 [Planctomycetota bacterium]
MDIGEEIIKRLNREIEKDLELETEMRQNSINLSTQNILEIRRLIVQTSLLSATIIGILFAFGEHSGCIKNKPYVVAAIILLMVVIVYALIYLKIILERENKKLPEIYNDYFSVISTAKNNREEVRDKILVNGFNEPIYQEYMQKMHQEKERLLQQISSRPPMKEDRILDVLLILFIGALLFILLSMVNFQWIKRLFFE